jgi:ribosomal protein L34
MKIKRRQSTLHRVRRSGFRARMKTHGGREVIRRRRRKGCHKLAPTRNS